MSILVRNFGYGCYPWHLYRDGVRVSQHRTESNAKRAGVALARVGVKRGRPATSVGYLVWKRGRAYVYKSVRDGATVRRKYIGTYDSWRSSHPRKNWTEFSGRFTRDQTDWLHDVDVSHAGRVWKGA